MPRSEGLLREGGDRRPVSLSAELGRLTVTRDPRDRNKHPSRDGGQDGMGRLSTDWKLGEQKQSEGGFLRLQGASSLRHTWVHDKKQQVSPTPGTCLAQSISGNQCSWHPHGHRCHGGRGKVTCTKR